MFDSIDRRVRVAVVYYSATGHVHALAKAVARGAADADATVRLRHVEELDPELRISQNQTWGRHRSEIDSEPVATSFTSSQTDHGGQESTILALNTTFYHWGAIVLPLGYTAREAFNGGGNPYGASYTSGTRIGQLDAHTVASATAQGARLARVARVIGRAQELGQLDVRGRMVAEPEFRPAPRRDSPGSVGGWTQ